MIKYDVDATASYSGGVAGLAATSPSVTGKPLADNEAAVARLRPARRGGRRLDQRAPSSRPSRTPRSGRRSRPPTAASRRRCPRTRSPTCSTCPASPRCRRTRSSSRSTTTRRSSAPPNVWPSARRLEQPPARTSIVGVIDTGVWPENPMLVRDRDRSPARGAAAAQLGPRAGRRAASSATARDTSHLGPAFNCNNKLIGAYAFLHDLPEP